MSGVLCRIVRCGVAASRSMVVFPPRCMSAAQVPICRFDERLFCSAREDPPDGANMSTAGWRRFPICDVVFRREDRFMLDSEGSFLLCQRAIWI